MFRTSSGECSPEATTVFDDLTVLENSGHTLGENQTDIIPIDGKTVRGSKSKSKRAVHMVSTWSSNLRLVLGQKKVDSKTNEITAIPELFGQRVGSGKKWGQKSGVKKVGSKKWGQVLNLDDRLNCLIKNQDLTPVFG